MTLKILTAAALIAFLSFVSFAAGMHHISEQCDLFGYFTISGTPEQFFFCRPIIKKAGP